jgi:hypothetical protein
MVGSELVAGTGLATVATAATCALLGSAAAMSKTKS